MELPRKPDQIISFNIKKMQIQSLILSAIALATGFIAVAFIHSPFTFSITILKLLYLLFLYLIGVVLHEFFHLIGFMLWGKCRWNDLVYGINRKLGVAYAGTKKNIRNHAMKKTLLLPFWLTGFVPFVIGICINHGVLVAASALLIGGAAGDFAMYRQLSKINRDAYIIDDLEKPQLYVYYDNPHNDKT